MSSIDRPNPIPPFAPAANAVLLDGEVQAFKRKRVRIVAAGFLVALILSLAANYLRPPVYRATALIEIEPPASQADAPVTLLLGKERERLLSESISRELHARFQNSLLNPDWDDSSPDIGGVLGAEIATNSNLIKLSAEGHEPEILSIIVNTWTEIYQQRLAATQNNSVEETRKALGTQLAEFQARIVEKRTEIGVFREKHDIVSDDTTRNRVPTHLQGISEALTQARQDYVEAVAELESLRRAVASGKIVTVERDERVIADLESRVQDLRAQIRDFDEQFTAAYEAYDPTIKAARKQLEEVEATLRAKRIEAQDIVIHEAEQAVNSTRVRVQVLKKEIGDYEGYATEFMGFHEQHESLKGELSELELQMQEIRNRIVETEVANRGLFPRIEVLEHAFTPDSPVRPDYTRDAIYGLAGSLVLAVLLSLFYSRLNDPRRYVTSESTQQPSIYSLHTELVSPATALPTSEVPSSTPALEHRRRRELSLVEVEALLTSSVHEDRLLIALLLSGLSVDEIVGLTPEAVDMERSVVRVTTGNERTLPLAAKLRDFIGHLADGDGLFATGESIHVRIAQLPYIAGLADPSTVDANALRHTYISFLVRQGMKFDELQRIVGRLDAQEMQQYGEMMPPMPGKSVDEVTLVYPALEVKLLRG